VCVTAGCALQVTWYREGVVIEQRERFKTELRTDVDQPHRCCLTIVGAEVADAGSYRLVVRNEFGEAELTISLLVNAAGK